MLDKSKIIEIAPLGEGHISEFKVILPNPLKGVVEEVCAFANASGCFCLYELITKNVVL